MRIEILRTSGKAETFTAANPKDALELIQREIAAEMLDTVNLRDGRVMFVDDAGYETRSVMQGNVQHLEPIAPRKPYNNEATRLYHAVCRPGTTHQIVGDVALVNDADFA